MRWPLRNQIFTRMLLLMVIAIGLLTFTSIRSIISANREAEFGQVQRVVELMTTSSFPLTSPVLENMKLLSNSEFVFTESNGEIVSQSTDVVPPTLPKVYLAENRQNQQTVPKSFEFGGELYYHTAVAGIQDRNPSANSGILHILVPRRSEKSIWWQASRSPLMIASFTLPLALLFSLALASQVTRPLAKLNRQVQQIAEGQIQQIPEVRRNDEIHELNVSINEMAVKLQDHEVQLRNNERLRTMVQFGNGIAHHLRNSTTGCKMAIELLGSEQHEVADSENYQVAIRQLELMDNYIKRFLLLSKSSDARETAEVGTVNPGQVLENVAFLLRPSAQHLGVKLTVKSDCDDSEIRMSEEDAQQLMMNLITNAIRAAAENSANRKPDEQGFVSVDLTVNRGHVKFLVADNGSGPPDKIARTLFEPFVSGSREGTGLGLSLVKAISNRTNGEVLWRRESDVTTFCFETGVQTGMQDKKRIQKEAR